MKTDNKADYKSEEFWKDAPEGATHYGERTEGSLEGWFQITSSGYKFRGKNQSEFFGSGNQGFGPCASIPMHARPQPKPVYTQEMHDKGELPSVGMECLVDGVHRELLLPIDSDDMGVIKVDGAYYIICLSALKPIDTRTDKEKAIDDIKKVIADTPYKTDEQSIKFFELIKSGKIHGVTWSKGNE